MKQLTCEMCGSNDLIKQDGVFVCQSCGCKYSVEEAKKMMVEGTVEVTGIVKVDTSGDAENLYRLGCLALEDGEWDKADKFFDDALNNNAEYAECYLGKLMAEFHIRNKEELKDCEAPFNSSNNYKKAIRFGDENLKTELEEYSAFISERVINASYNNALDIMNNANTEEDYKKAAIMFDDIKGYKDSESLAKECIEKAEELKSERLLKEESKRAKIREKYRVLNIRQCISTGKDYTVGLKADGSVVAVGNGFKEKQNVLSWKDIVSVSAGENHVVGLKADGTVVAVCSNSSGECNFVGWKDITAISAGNWHTVGLKADGTVVAVGSNYKGECNVSDWKDITAISAGNWHTAGLRSDGTVVCTGDNGFGQCDVSDWKDIVAISARKFGTIGLKWDGTVVSAGNVAGQSNISGWKDIVAVSAGDNHTVGLKADGTVVATGNNKFGQCNVSAWRGIIEISAGNNRTVGLNADGTVVATYAGNNAYLSGQANIATWKNIAMPPMETTVEELFIREKREYEGRKEKRNMEEEKRMAEEQLRKSYRDSGRCQHCGGELKGLFTKTCSKCGRKKDY